MKGPFLKTQTHDWQCVLICWGDKYGRDDIMGIATQILARSRRTPDIVLLTDHIRADIPPHVTQRIMPDFYLAPAFLKGGCQAKLALFQKGVLPRDLPTVFVDLDTAILGDLSKMLERHFSPAQIAMLGNNPLSFSGLGRLAHRLSGGKLHTRGNSLFIAFQPSQFYDVDRRFRAEFAKPMPHPKPMQADDRFLSWAFQQDLRAIPNTFAVKFPREFMKRSVSLAKFITALPWVARRRAALIAITFPGAAVDLTILANIKDGDQIIDKRGRKLIWSDAFLGATKKTIRAYVTALHNKEP